MRRTVKDKDRGSREEMYVSHPIPCTYAHKSPTHSLAHTHRLCQLIKEIKIANGVEDVKKKKVRRKFKQPRRLPAASAPAASAIAAIEPEAISPEPTTPEAIPSPVQPSVAAKEKPPLHENVGVHIAVTTPFTPRHILACADDYNMEALKVCKDIIAQVEKDAGTPTSYTHTIYSHHTTDHMPTPYIHTIHPHHISTSYTHIIYPHYTSTPYIHIIHPRHTSLSYTHIICRHHLPTSHDHIT